MDTTKLRTTIKIYFKKKDISVPANLLMTEITEINWCKIKDDLEFIIFEYGVNFDQKVRIMDTAFQQGASIISIDKPYRLPF
jgi:hypothetical protein